MLRKVLLNIMHNNILKEVLSIIGSIVMIVLIVWTIMNMDTQEIEFVYANF